MPKSLDSPLYTTAEAAAYLNVSRRVVERASQAGAIPVVRLTARTLFHRDDLDAYIRAHRVRVPAKKSA